MWLLLCVTIGAALVAPALGQGCNAEEVEYCAMAFCAQCRAVNGVPGCTDEPILRDGQICASKCIAQIRACTYYEYGAGPTASFVYPRCFNASSALECASVSTPFGTFGSPVFHDVGSFCRRGLGAGGTDGAVVLADGYGAVCASPYDLFGYNGTDLANMQGVCIATTITGSQGDIGSPANRTLVFPVCASGCSLLFTYFLGGGGFPNSFINGTQCYSCALDLSDPTLCANTDLCIASPYPQLAFDTTDAFLYDSFFNLPNDTVSVPGICYGRVCVGPWNSTLVGANTANDMCQTGACRTTVPTKPPLPATFQQIYDSLSYEIAPATIAEGEVCVYPSGCVTKAICRSMACTPIADASPVCERLGCRRCAPTTGRCIQDGDFVPMPAGSPCKIGCQFDEDSVCDGAGQCIATPGDTFLFCVVETGAPFTEEQRQCVAASCIPRTVIPVSDPLLQRPVAIGDGVNSLTESVIVDAINRLVGSTGLSECNVPILDGFGCDDGDACTTGDTCNVNATCVPSFQKNSGCLLTTCRDCNSVTGNCDGDQSFGSVCSTGCGVSGTTFAGVCTGSGCLAVPPDTSFCPDTSGGCSAFTCVSSFTSPPPLLAPIGANITLAAIAPFLAHVCAPTPLPDGASCSAARSAGNLCVLDEECQLGQCEITLERNCTLFFLAGSCYDTGNSFCRNTTGFCEATVLANGTACNDGTACTSGEVCMTPPSPPGFAPIPVCTPATTVDCTPLLANPCIAAVACNPVDGECLKTYQPQGTSCPRTNFGVCQSVGICNGFGDCVPGPLECPQPVDTCVNPTCANDTGLCGFEARPDFAECSDGNRCTEDDFCLSGTCGGTTLNCSLGLLECQVPSGPCDPTNGCVPSDAPNGTPCSLGACTFRICCYICDPPCQNNGCCPAQNATVCNCPTGFFGAHCETTQAELAEEPFVDFTGEVTKGLNFLVPYLIWILAGILAFSLLVAVLCTARAKSARINAIGTVEWTQPPEKKYE